MIKKWIHQDKSTGHYWTGQIYVKNIRKAKLYDTRKAAREEKQSWERIIALVHINTNWR